MRKQVLAFAVLALSASLASADNKLAQTATIVSQTSVDCGTKKQGKKQSTSVLTCASNTPFAHPLPNIRSASRSPAV